MAAGRRSRGAKEEAAAAAPSADAERPVTWDERRQLAADVAALAAPDLPGALLIAREHLRSDQELALREYEQEDEDARLQLECALDLDAASNELLRALRSYVDACFVPVLAPKPQCCVCQGLWSSGRVVSCANDACPVRVHEECFGVLLRARGADGPWRCPSCLVGRDLLCAVCMQTGGALKPLTSTSGSGDNEQKWVHVLCALAIPELAMRDVPTMEPVDGFDDIENGRFRYLCGVCRKRGGASIICEHEACNVGMHPQCAADAGLMIGSETNPMGIYCEKHLPLSRVPGATRWISDEDLVEEIMSEYSIDEELADDMLGIGSDYQGVDKYAFILESTPFVARLQKLFGRLSASFAPPIRTKKARQAELKARDVRAVNSSAIATPAAVTQAMQRVRAPEFPPHVSELGQDVIGLPAFPAEEDAVGAIVDYFVKEQDEWERARVVQWDATRSMHLVHLVRTDQKLWTTLSNANTLVLYLPGDENLVDGVRVRLYRPWLTGKAKSKNVVASKNSGASGSADGRQWRPKPRQFAAATT